MKIESLPYVTAPAEQVTDEILEEFLSKEYPEDDESTLVYMTIPSYDSDDSISPVTLVFVASKHNRDTILSLVKPEDIDVYPNIWYGMEDDTENKNFAFYGMGVMYINEKKVPVILVPAYPWMHSDGTPVTTDDVKEHDAADGTLDISECP